MAYQDSTGDAIGRDGGKLEGIWGLVTEVPQWGPGAEPPGGSLGQSPKKQKSAT